MGDSFDMKDMGDFLDASSESRLRVESDLGDGFVRLRVTEAQKRQAKQDIRSAEDVAIELLRNAILRRGGKIGTLDLNTLE